MENICLVALVGLPAVGKTSFSKSLLESESLPFNILHLCYDNYITFNLENPGEYKDQREKLLKSLASIIQEFKTSKTLNNLKIWDSLKFQYKNLNHKDLIIICDDNHYYHSMRYKLYQMARQYHIGYGQIYFECQVEIALERNNLRLQTTKIPEEIFIKMSKRLEPPNMVTNTWEENTLIVQQSNFNNILLKSLPFINKLLKIPIKPLEPETEKIVTPQSIVHDLDLLMRKRINHMMKNVDDTNKKLMAMELNNKRKAILKKFQLNVENKIGNVLEQSDLDLNKYVEMLE